MKKLFAIILICMTNNVWAQPKHPIENSASLTNAFGKNEFSGTIALQHLYKLGKHRHLGVGAGVRLTSYFGKDQYYTTAPAKLTSGKTGPGVFFSDNIEQNIDTVLFNKPQVNSVNLSLNFSYEIYKSITLGFNIDAIGFSFGSKKTGTYFSNAGADVTVRAKPTSFNALLISDNDKGSLNSEFYGAYQFDKLWSGKIGFQFLFTEYKTDSKIQITPDGQMNDRFRNKSSGIFVGVIRRF